MIAFIQPLDTLNCEGTLLNARGGSFCAAHENQFGNQCRVRECTSDRLLGSQACALHEPEWNKYVYQHS